MHFLLLAIGAVLVFFLSNHRCSATMFTTLPKHTELVATAGDVDWTVKCVSALGTLMDPLLFCAHTW